MADPFTIVSTTLAAISHAFKLGQQCYELINGIKGAPDNINRLATDLKSLYTILGTLQAVLESEDAKKGQTVIPSHMVSNVKELVDNCVKLFVDVNVVVKPYTGADGRALRSNWKGFRWEFNKGSIEELQKTLSQYKLTLDLACSSLSFFNSSQTVEMVQRIEKDIRKLQNQIENREREEVYQHYQEHPMLDGSYEGFSDASYNIPMRRFLERTETIVSSSSRSLRYPSMILSDNGSDHTTLPDDSASIMDTGRLSQESEDIQNGVVQAEMFAEESNTAALVSSSLVIEPEDSLFIDRSKSIEDANKGDGRHLTTTIREGPELQLNYRGLGYFDISGGNDANDLGVKTGYAEAELLREGCFSTDEGNGPTNSVYFGPYLKYINMDLERGVWLGSIMLITHAPQPPTIHIHQKVDLSPNPRQLKASPIYAHRNWVFYRYDVDLQIGERGSAKWIYAITSHIACTRYEFLVAGRYETNWRFIAHSGNDFSTATNHYERQQLGGVGVMWKDILQKNVDCGGFHVQLGLGGQICGGRVWKEVPLLRQWLAISGKDNRENAEWTAKHEEDISQALFHYYTMHFDQPYLREAFAQIPHILQIDDYEIFDSFGSYPRFMQSSHMFKNIGRISIKMYLLFQHHTTIELLQNVSNDVDLFTITGAGWHFVKYLGPAVVVVGPDVRSERTQQQVMAGPTYQGLFRKVATLPPSVQHCIWMIAVPVIYPRLEAFENSANFMQAGKKVVNTTNNIVGKVSSWVVGQKELGQFGFSQAKKAAGKSGLKGGVLDSSGDVDITGELQDMWIHESKDLERTYLIRTLQGIAHQKGIRMTFVSGQVRCCGAGLVHDPSHPSDHKTMYQIISSSIVAAPQSNYILNMLHNYKVLYVPMNGQKSTHVASDTKEDMLEIFQTDPNGAVRELKKLMSRRNYVAFVAYGPEETPRMSDGTGNYTRSQLSLSQRLSKLSLAVDFIVQGDKAMSASTRYGPVIIPHLDFGR